MTPNDLRHRLEQEALEAIELGRQAQVSGRVRDADRFADYAAALLNLVGNRAMIHGLARELPDDFGKADDER